MQIRVPKLVVVETGFEAYVLLTCKLLWAEGKSTKIGWLISSSLEINLNFDGF